jgi:hypothetical protein
VLAGQMRAAEENVTGVASEFADIFAAPKSTSTLFRAYSALEVALPRPLIKLPQAHGSGRVPPLAERSDQTIEEDEYKVCYHEHDNEQCKIDQSPGIPDPCHIEEWVRVPTRQCAMYQRPKTV